MKVKSFDGVPISYEIDGSGQPSLVFIHGSSCNRRFWEYQTPHFKKHHTVVTLDLAGHGESGSNRSEWSMRSFGRDVASVIETIGLDRAVLVGHSMGGRVAVEAADIVPDWVTGIVGIDCFQRLDAWKPPEQMLRLPVHSYQDDLRNTITEFVTSTFCEGADPALVERVIDDMASVEPAISAGITRGIIEHDLVSVMERLEIPVRCISAQWKPSDLEATGRIAADFHAVYMDGVGHFAMMEDPDTFNSLLDGYLGELSS